MVDDLITRGADEPYRMFTSRAEYRLLLRADNADQRLTRLGVALGCVGSARAQIFESKAAAIASARARLESVNATPDALAQHGIKINRDGVRRTAFDLLTMPDTHFGQAVDVWPALADIAPAVRATMEIEAKYARYLDRQAADVEAYRRDEALMLPDDFDYRGVPGLSNEIAEKLDRLRPATLGQAGRVPGVTPAALVVLLRFVRRKHKKSTGSAQHIVVGA